MSGTSEMLTYQERRRLGKRLDGSATEQMRQWVRELNRLNIIHIACTKGKDTTCAFDALESSALREGLDPVIKPKYFRLLTLMSFHVFIREAADIGVYEVGEELDSTNVVDQLAVTGVTTLGMDHIKTLGDAIEKIACPAFTVEQVPDAMKLTAVAIIPALQNVDVKPAEDFQRKNAFFAISLAHTALEKFRVPSKYNPESLPNSFVQGLETVVWRGRCETFISGQLHWHLDGAHTENSLEATFHYAVFCTNITYKSCSYKPDFVNRNVNLDALRNLTLQEKLAAVWHELDPSTVVATPHSIEEAIEYVKSVITGGFHLAEACYLF
ncbi:Mur ligase [Aspergillus alliaceus]|uniref:tetrahydrofolate synthase n=1 Tax=Petromyces alliaceus TaxID=209559 RepID=A0A5N7C2F2_PETAA|nr:Mur ligase [Aspergillus alliaceus]